MDHPEPNPLLSDSPAAWDSLIESIGPAALLVVIESRLGAALRRHFSAEDILQDAMLHAWRDRHRCEWRGLRSFRAWLLTIIDHRILEAAKRESAAKRGGPDGPAQLAPSGPDSTTGASQFPAGSTTPSRIALHREQAAAIRVALDGLPADLREIVRLRLLEQSSLEDVARSLDLTVPIVRYRFARGLELYRERLREYFSTRAQARPDISSAVPARNSSAK